VCVCVCVCVCVQVGALRLYTGPMYMAYNTELRKALAYMLKVKRTHSIEQENAFYRTREHIL